MRHSSHDRRFAAANSKVAVEQVADYVRDYDLTDAALVASRRAGAKLARPERLVVSLVGDGSFLFSVPSSALWVQRRYNAPTSGCACNRCNRAAAAR